MHSCQVEVKNRIILRAWEANFRKPATPASKRDARLELTAIPVRHSQQHSAGQNIDFARMDRDQADVHAYQSVDMWRWKLRRCVANVEMDSPFDRRICRRLFLFESLRQQRVIHRRDPIIIFQGVVLRADLIASNVCLERSLAIFRKPGRNSGP